MLYQGTLTLPSCLALSECSTLNDPFTPRNRVQLNSPYKQAGGLYLRIKRISIECRKAQNYSNYTTNQRKGKYLQEPMRMHGKNKQTFKARENARDQVAIGFSFDADWLKGRRSKVKQNNPGLLKKIQNTINGRIASQIVEVSSRISANVARCFLHSFPNFRNPPAVKNGIE